MGTNLSIGRCNMPTCSHGIVAWGGRPARGVSSALPNPHSVSEKILMKTTLKNTHNNIPHSNYS